MGNTLITTKSGAFGEPRDYSHPMLPEILSAAERPTPAQKKNIQGFLAWVPDVFPLSISRLGFSRPYSNWPLLYI